MDNGRFRRPSNYEIGVAGDKGGMLRRLGITPGQLLDHKYGFVGVRVDTDRCCFIDFKCTRSRRAGRA